jgi:hypothetical protein
VKLAWLHSEQRFIHTLLVGVLLLAVWFRVWQLNTIPPGLWFDEAYYAMDAVWLRQTQTWPIFLLGNNGREPLFSYLLAGATRVFGETAYTARWVTALLGTLAIPLTYRFIFTMFGRDSQARWLALLAAAGLAISFWAVLMNRSAYRANLLPLFVLIVSYFFWQGRQTGQWRYYLLAGIALGLSQYSYLSARLLPVAFGLFMLIQTGIGWQNSSVELKKAWLGLGLMALASLLITIPLLLFFVDHPEAFWGRAGEVAVKIGWSPEALQRLLLHGWAAMRVFIDGQDPNWRHHLQGRPVLDVFNTLGFWPGLLIAFKRYRQPHYLFLLILLVVMWLPALLSDPAFHTLRLSGILPAYYALVAVGLLHLTAWLNRGLFTYWFHLKPMQVGLLTLLGLLLGSGSLTLVDYFYRWAKAPQVYQVYDGPVVELTHYLTTPQESISLIIPFYLYTHASVRYLLNDTYGEEVLMPASIVAGLQRQENTMIMIPTYPPDDGELPAWVWLVKEAGRPGAAYVSEVTPRAVLANLKLKRGNVIQGSHNNSIAQTYALETDQALSWFRSQIPVKQGDFTWADNLRLVGYEFTPAAIKTDALAVLHLNWQLLGYTGLEAKMFIQLLDSQANPMGQHEFETLSRKMYRWRKDGLILQQIPLNFTVSLKPGLYFVRLGYFNPETQQRLQVEHPASQPIGDEVILGPLYIYGDGVDPVKPLQPQQAKLGNIKILGHTVSPAADGAPVTKVKLYWQSLAPVEQSYTAFVQLLDAQNQLLAQHDHQPLNNLYPTNRWQPGDIIVDEFTLMAPIGALSKPNRLVTGMYDLATGVRLPAYNDKDEPLPEGLVELVN